MARLTDDQWESLEADWHTGQYSKNELSKRYNISHTSVNKRLKGVEPKHLEKVSTISTMKAELAKESFKEVSAVETAIDERTKHLVLFNNSALENQRKANLAINSIKDDKVDEKSLYSLEAHSRITQRNKETVLGKDKTTEINNTNATQNNLTIEDISRQIGDLLPD